MCGGALAWALTSRPLLPPRPPWEFPRLPIEQVKAPVPARFAGPLPSRVEDFWQRLEQGPPLAQVRLRLLEGDREMSERFLSALQHAAALTQDEQALAETYGEALWPERPVEFSEAAERDLVRSKGEPPCAWLREQLEARGTEHTFLSRLLWWKLALCYGPQTEALFARDEAPPALVIENSFQFGLPRFTAAMDKAVRRLLAEDQQELFERATALLSQSPDPAAQALAEQLVRQARGAFEEPVREARALYQRQAEYLERECRELPISPEGVDPVRIDTCLMRWAQADRPATARLASLLISRPGISSFQQESFVALTRFASDAQADAWARERGLLPAPWVGPEARWQDQTLSGRMLDTNRAFLVHPFLREVEPFSSAYEQLLVSLAWSVDPALRGVAFEEVPPAEDARTGQALSGSTLHAYMDGERFSLQTLSPDSGQDVGAVLALLNRLLEARGSTTRFVVLADRSTALTLASGPADALREADALRLLPLGDGREVAAWAREASKRGMRPLP